MFFYTSCLLAIIFYDNKNNFAFKNVTALEVFTNRNKSER